MKKLFTALIGLLLVCVARADSYMYWMLEDVTDSRLEFYHVAVYAQGKDGEPELLLNSVTPQGETAELIESRPDHRGLESAYYAILPDNPAGMIFYIELYKGDDTVGVSGTVTYETLAAKSHIYEEPGTGGTVSPYVFAAEVPEPSGGLLCLLGFGLMALRRRREKV